MPSQIFEGAVKKSACVSGVRWDPLGSGGSSGVRWVLWGPIQWNSQSPEFREKFLFSLEDPSETETRTLAFYLHVVSPDEGKGTGLPGRDLDSYSLLGEALLPLKDVPLFSAYSNWLPLHDVFHQKPVGLGEVMCSLSYLPTAERLTVVIVKARSLLPLPNHSTVDPYVKVYLLQSGKKVQKKKTSTKKNDPAPVYNEAMIFSVPHSTLHITSLRLVLLDAKEEGNEGILGLVVLGPKATGRAYSHWNQMMTSLRKPIAMWHPIQCKKKNLITETSHSKALGYYFPFLSKGYRGPDRPLDAEDWDRNMAAKGKFLNARLSQLAHALDYPDEECGIAHRDVKGENVLATHRLNAKLSDFGFARRANGVDPVTGRTQCGTLPYAASEMIRREAVDAWFSGVVLAKISAAFPFETQRCSLQEARSVRIS
ncbi:unnamed protein product [Darwinula stevensoni]|uniref:Uncharacterized protein n=1 Tax=Darwinula stevensoni TaxID=69355 RepID=A0A7R9AA11_9CRUS|nr:unnamed protein product [Darwinula stevensoni]CAG0897974.1 unnamed protein product [Darwinula stevensoni]